VTSKTYKNRLADAIEALRLLLAESERKYAQWPIGLEKSYGEKAAREVLRAEGVRPLKPKPMPPPATDEDVE